MKISGVYKITNTITNDFYIGSSKNVKHRWAHHKCPSEWKKHPNNSLYNDMQKYGVDKFDFQILIPAEPDCIKELEQQFIETLKPTYNNRRANGWDIERIREYQKEYQKEYHQSDKYKECHNECCNKYNNQLCSYNGEMLTLNALASRFYRAGIKHPTIEAKKYLLVKQKYKDNI